MTTRKRSSAHALRAFAVAFAMALLPWRTLPAASLPERSAVPDPPRAGASSRFT
jgi:hypothetical protein